MHLSSQAPSRSSNSLRVWRLAFPILFTILLASLVLVIPWQASKAAGDELTVVADADTYIDGNEPNKGYGVSDLLAVKDNPPAVAFVRFEVKGVPQGGPLNARLRLLVKDGSAGAAANLNAFRVTGTWDENSLTWNMQPALGDQIGASEFEPLNEGAWAEIDLGNAVTGDGIYSFAITSNTPDRVSFASSSTEDEAPELVISVESSLEPTDSETEEATSEATDTSNDDARVEPTDSTDETLTPEATEIPEDEDTSEDVADPTDTPDSTITAEPTDDSEDEDLSEPTDDTEDEDIAEPTDTPDETPTATIENN